MALDRDFDQASAAHAEPNYKKRRRSDLMRLFATVLPQSYVDAHAAARADRKSVGEYICGLIRADIAARAEKHRAKAA